MTVATDPAAPRGAGPWHDEGGRSRWHDEKGHFKVGNPGGPGNPVSREMAAWRQRLRDSTTPAMFDHVVSALFGQAIRGKLPAIKLFLEYVCGKPDKSID